MGARSMSTDSNSNDYLPLTVGHVTLPLSSAYASPTRGSYFHRTLQWFKIWRFAFLQNEFSRERQLIEEQLSMRKSFPNNAWQKCNLPMNVVCQILDRLRIRMNWPNRNYLPNDPLQLLLIQQNDEFASWEFLLDLKDGFKIKCSGEELASMAHEGQTVEGLIRDVLKKQRSGSSTRASGSSAWRCWRDGTSSG